MLSFKLQAFNFQLFKDIHAFPAYYTYIREAETAAVAMLKCDVSLILSRLCVGSLKQIQSHLG